VQDDYEEQATAPTPHSPSSLAKWVQSLCQLIFHEIPFVNAGFGDFGGVWGVDMEILGCF
jgi:hypothetical protein